MCSKDFCLGKSWCSEWGCCLSDDNEMDHLQELKAKNKKLEVVLSIAGLDTKRVAGSTAAGPTRFKILTST